MIELSTKATILLEILKRLEAVDSEHKVNIYDIMKELDDIDLREIIPELEDYEIDNLECEMTQKSISTTLASLVRKGLIEKTGVSSVQIEGITRNIRSYYLTNNQE